MKNFLRIIFSIVVLYIIYVGAKYAFYKFNNNEHDPYWHVEKNAVASQSHPLAGFYKSENCKDPWGWAVGPIGTDKYYISFCGPGGCFPEGTYRPNTTIYNDSDYEVVDKDTIKMKSKNGWKIAVRCNGRT